MQTNEERIRLIQKRTAEIKQERQRRKQRMADAVCMAVCLLLVTGIGDWMSELTVGTGEESVSHPSGTASMIGSHAALGYIIMGLLAFSLGVCVTVLLYRLRRRNERKRLEAADNMEDTENREDAENVEDSRDGEF